MAPRGVAIPDLRERLFGAAERIVARDGASALTSRAITGEAGCAKGVLHTHFGGVDAFVAELVLDRFARTAREAAKLPARAGQDTVAENLVRVALSLLDSLDPGVVGLAMASHATSRTIRASLAAGAPGFASIQDALTDYLDAELRIGRLADGTDTAAMALALVGTVHHLLMTGWAGAPDPREQTERLVALLVSR
ncbi:TetR family transcriptional regulator [Streptomyces sp. WAC 01529]|uniref:TetR/AcrR family transcriptional regulator n=1 Tax=Streptomyces sp. WAC 01529 TaxID=2203205 RepID=UPI000F6B81C6|nr:TetR/AcrR family transcriptional regulator [Streptomyces sp. WAC 01529]AZM51702.1 TetR family transcriptional regulator [Streptomyces sp. WAC 01529]